MVQTRETGVAWAAQAGLDIDMSSVGWLPVNTLTDQKDLSLSGDWQEWGIMGGESQSN